MIPRTNGNGNIPDGKLGDRAVVILLHPFGGSSRTWDEVTSLLGDDIVCVAPDLRGFGRLACSFTPGVGYAVDDYADDVESMVRELGFEQYVLAGHSMGGKVALAVSARRPTGLRSLVLVAPSPPTPEPMPDGERSRLLAGHGDSDAMLETIEKIVAAPLSPAVLKRVLADYLLCSPAAWRAWLEHGSREDISAAVSRIEVPALVIAGAADPVVPPTLAKREVLDRLAHARLHTIEGAGHLLPLEAPAEIARLIRDEVMTCT